MPLAVCKRRIRSRAAHASIRQFGRTVSDNVADSRRRIMYLLMRARNN